MTHQLLSTFILHYIDCMLFVFFSSELLSGERYFRRKMRRKQDREKANAKRRAEFKKKHVLLTIGERV
jgi:hypothetical protein